MDYSYIGSGKIYLREIGGAGGLVEVGNASALKFAVSEDAKELKDYTQAGGGTWNEVRRINAVEVSMSLHELSPENLSRALYGNSTAVASATETDEAHADVVVGALVLTNYLATSITTVKRGATTLTAGSDYEVRGAGVVMIGGGPNTVVTGDDITITYVRASADVVQALTTSGKEYEMVFDGLNEARSGKKTRVRVYRVKIGTAKDVGLIGADFAALDIQGKILKDKSISGVGLSQYFRVDIEH